MRQNLFCIANKTKASCLIMSELSKWCKMLSQNVKKQGKCFHKNFKKGGKKSSKIFQKGMQNMTQNFQKMREKVVIKFTEREGKKSSQNLKKGMKKLSYSAFTGSGILLYDLVHFDILFVLLHSIKAFSCFCSALSQFLTF
jgi:hypothetical protein